MSVVTSDIAAAVQLLANGHLCALPTETVYGLAADASSSTAVARIFEAKNRPQDHPLIVHVADYETALLWFDALPVWAQELARSCWPGPLTLVGNRTQLATDQITGGQHTVAVRIPAHPMARALLVELKQAGVPGLVAPSANRFGHVSPTTAEHVAADLGAYLAQHGDGILDGGPSEIGIESTIVLATGSSPRILRPGAIGTELIESITGISVDAGSEGAPRVSGALASHYSPDAQVIVIAGQGHEDFQANSGLIALIDIPTPAGVTRLASPADSNDFASQLYEAMRQGDQLNLHQIYVALPTRSGIGVAIADRVAKAAFVQTQEPS
jgi:L-threonylcarbamoyladenylate synthase